MNELSTDRDPRVWAAMIVEAALDGRDTLPLLELARRAGADFDELQRLLDGVSDIVCECIADTGPSFARLQIHDSEPLLTVDDFHHFKNLRFDSW